MGKSFMACCGKMIFAGCEHAHDLQSNERMPTCPFCRTAATSSAKEYTTILGKRVDCNDANATYELATMYLKGDHRFSMKTIWTKHSSCFTGC
jgi:hypothetical protein